MAPIICTKMTNPQASKGNNQESKNFLVTVLSIISPSIDANSATMNKSPHNPAPYCHIVNVLLNGLFIILQAYHTKSRLSSSKNGRVIARLRSVKKDSLLCKQHLYHIARITMLSCHNILNC